MAVTVAIGRERGPRPTAPSPHAHELAQLTLDRARSLLAYWYELAVATTNAGTPEQDALRRDFTLNALFFNVHSRAIEDYTKRGWDDLRTGIMRTPLEPRVTLLDDPLRALRGVRFASRYCFALEQGFVGACLLPEVRAALLAKVSRERVGKEVWGALATSPLGSARAVDEFRKLQLASPTFRGCMPPESKCEVVGHAHAPSGARVPLSQVFAEDADDAAADSPWLLSARCVRALADAEVAAADAVDRDAAVVAEAGVAAVASSGVVGPLEARDATLAALAAALLPLSGDDAFVVDKKKRRTPLPSAVCKDGLKLPGRTVQDAQKVLDAAPKFASLAKRLDAKLADDGAEPWGDLRRDAGLVLFDVKRNWRTALRVAPGAIRMGAAVGDSVSSDLRDEVSELLVKMEAKNPTEEPATSALLNGVWDVAYQGYAPGPLPSPTRPLALALYAGGFTPGVRRSVLGFLCRLDGVASMASRRRRRGEHRETRRGEPAPGIAPAVEPTAPPEAGPPPINAFCPPGVNAPLPVLLADGCDTIA